MADCPPFGTYGFQHVAFVIDGVLVTGWDEGDDVISIEPNSDLVTSKSGADGTRMASITSDQSVTITIKLMPNSPTNRFLRNKVSRMRGGGLSNIRFPVGFTDLTSGESAGCTNAIVSGEPTQTRGNEVNALEWKIDCPCWQHETVRVAQGVAG